jgi:hypothetical protein
MLRCFLASAFAIIAAAASAAPCIDPSPACTQWIAFSESSRSLDPSSYAYLDPRLTLDTGNACVSCPSAKAGDVRADADGRDCTTFDDWPFGLKKRAGYAASVSDDRLKQQLAARPTTYLLGEIDILPLGGFDSSCPAMAQGPTRRARGEAFGKYVSDKYGAKHKVAIVSLCGHNARCIYTADPTLPLIFPKP